MTEDPQYWVKRDLERFDNWTDKQNEFTVQSGHAAVKAAFLLNGGAVLALLAFLANVLTAPSLDPEQRALLARIVSQLSTFAWGACLAAISFGLSYLVNRLYLEGNLQKTKHTAEPIIRPGKRTALYVSLGNWIAGLAIVTTAVSLVFFMIGLIAITATAPSVASLTAPPADPARVQLEPVTPMPPVAPMAPEPSPTSPSPPPALLTE